MKIIITSIIFLIISSTSFSQQNIWEPTGGNTWGDIYKLFVSPSDVLFASTTVGLYKSTNNGAEWININNGLEQNRVMTMVFKESGDIFVGTNPGIGIFKSTDEGESWVYLNDSLVSFSIGKLAINSKGHLFAAIGGHGLYRSTDNGENWEEVNNDLSKFLLYVSNIGITKDYLFAATSSEYDSAAVFFSTDDGVNWSQMNLYLTDQVASAIIINSDGEVYAGTFDVWPFSRGTLLKSADGGMNWSWAGLSGNIGILVLDPDENIYTCLGPDGWTCGGGPYRTTDRGVSWELFTSGLPNGCYYALTCNSQGFLFIGVEHGVYRTIESTTDINENEEVIPSEFALYQNYPNPFNPSTTIQYQIPQSGNVTLKVYDLLGEEIRTLVNEEKVAGNYEINFEASALKSGVYFYTLQAYNFRDTKKMILIK